MRQAQSLLQFREVDPAVADHVGVVDVGSNSVRMVIYRVDAYGNCQEVENVKRVLRLGGRLTPEGDLPAEAMDDLYQVLRQFRRLGDAWQVSEAIAVATAVFREARNGAQVLEGVSEALGVPIRLLSGQEEAMYGVWGVQETMPYQDCLVVDLGGASVELTAIRDSEPQQSVSLPVGALTLTQRFMQAESDGRGYDALSAFLSNLFASYLWIQGTPGPLVVLGGTARSVARMRLGRELTNWLGVHHQMIGLQELQDFTLSANRMTPATRAEQWGLSIERSELLMAGLAVFAALMGTDRDRLVVCGAGLREGLLFERLATRRGRSIPQRMAASAAERLIAPLRPEATHRCHVRDLALALWESLGERVALPPPAWSRDVLEVAALLRGLGLVIGAHGFETHTFHWIARVPLAGLSATDRLIAALVAAYRTPRTLRLQSRPFKTLLQSVPGEWLEQMGSVLLLAEGLDRTRQQLIRSVRLEGAGRDWKLLCSTGAADLLEPALLTEVLERFEKTFKCRVQVTLLYEEGE